MVRAGTKRSRGGNRRGDLGWDVGVLCVVSLLSFIHSFILPSMVFPFLLWFSKSGYFEKRKACEYEGIERGVAECMSRVAPVTLFPFVAWVLGMLNVGGCGDGTV